MQLLALVAPLIITEWGITKAAFGPALSAALIGMSLGPVAGGWLGDRMGRRGVLVSSVMLFGLSTVLVAIIHSAGELVLLRLVGGFAFGATAPNTMSLVSARLPASLRAKAISWLSIGVPLGGLLGASGLSLWLPTLGWRGSFALFGTVSMLIAGAVFFVVPTAPVPAALPAGQAAAPSAQAPRPPLDWQFNVGMWLAFFCSTYVAYGCLAWVPTITVMNGLPLALGLRAIFAFNLLALCSAVAGGFVVDAVGPRRVLIAGSVAAGAALCLLLGLFGLPGTASGSPVAIAFPLATGVIGGATGMLLAVEYLVMVQGNPPARRAMAVGLGMLVGRLGGICSSYFGGMLLGEGRGHSAPYYLLMLCAVGGILLAVAVIGARGTDRALA